MSRFVDKLGQDQATRLSAIVGGTQISVPDTVDASAFNAGTLRDRLGESLFVLLVFHFGGTRLYVPQVADQRQSGRRTGQARLDHKRVASLTKRGWSATRIARKLGCSDRAVFASRAKSKACDDKAVTTTPTTNGS
jgi:hypothetical protein